MKIKDIMTVDVVTLPPEASVEEAARLLRDAGVGIVPIVSGRSVLGVLTDRDIVVRAAAEGLDMQEVKVRDILTPGVVNCFEDGEVDEAARLMGENRVRRIVVLTREHQLAGLLSLADIAANTPKAGEILREVSRSGPRRAGARASEAAAVERPGDEAESSLRGPGVSETLEQPARRGPIAALVKGELSAVETYKQALEKVGGPGGAELRRIEREHEEAVKLLLESLARRGGKAPRGSGLRGAWSMAVEGAAKLLGKKAAIKALKNGERRGLHHYEDALKDEALDPEVKALIRSKLLPQTRAHLPLLDRVLETV